MHKKIELQELKNKLSERNILTSDFMSLINYLSKQEYCLVECIRAHYVNQKKKQEYTFRIPYALLTTYLNITNSNAKRLVRNLDTKRIICKLEDQKYKWNIQGLDQYLCVQEDSSEVKQEKYLQKQNKPAPVQINKVKQGWPFIELT